jgi:hypothetical protein
VPGRSGLDLTTRAALRAILNVRADVQVMDQPSIVPDSTATADPPVIAAAEQIERCELRPIRLSDPSVGFAAFLDGTQRARVLAWPDGVPYVFGTVGAAIRSRRDRRLITWDQRPAIVEHRFYLPLHYLGGAGIPTGSHPVVDTTSADVGARMPSRHPAALLERAMQCVQRDRERVEQVLAQQWLDFGDGVLCADGPLPAGSRTRRSPSIVGVVKTHRIIYAEGAMFPLVLSLRRGERSPVFRVATSAREPVMSWYLRTRDHGGRDALWGLVRIEAALCEAVSERADEVSSWLLAEGSPLALPDPRWDRMTYGIRDCESFLRAIS